MAMVTREILSRFKTIVGVTAVDNTADSLTFRGEDLTFICVSGNIWVNPNATAVANATALKLTVGQAIEMMVDGTLSIISDAGGATYQYIVWGA